MPIRIEAYVLLAKPGAPDFDEVVSELEWRYPQVGKVRLQRGSETEYQATLVVEGAPVEIHYVGAPYPLEQLHPPTRTIGYDVDEVMRLTANLSGYVVVSVSSEQEGLDWTLAYAALVTLVASTVASQSKAAAIFWPDSWSCLPPAKFDEAASSVLCGKPPLTLWIALATANPARVGGAEMSGIATLGLRKFAGRELELAPMPAVSSEATGCIREAAGRLLSGEWSPEDFETLKLKSLSEPLTVRIAEEGFLRLGMPAVVLVSPDAAVDAETLTRKGSVPKPEGRSGLIGRLFGRG
jgi:hypothetical protein